MYEGLIQASPRKDLKAILSNGERTLSSEATSNALDPDMSRDGPMG
jgi:hypothetical protein